MRIFGIMSAALALALLFTGPVSSARAERGRDNTRQRSDRRFQDRDHNRGRFEAREREHARDRNWVLDRRYNHNHYYPRRGYRVQTLPRGYRVFRHHRQRYFFLDGVWYQPSGLGFTVVAPPIGMTVSLLPPYYTTLWVGGVPYYYADGTYYRWLPQQRVYEVTAPPPENKVVEDSGIPKSLFIYPKKGQSAEQQDTDRYECHRWSVGQTGFDPTQPGGNVPAAQNTVKRGDYQRAMKACLEARGYSVQ